MSNTLDKSEDPQDHTTVTVNIGPFAITASDEGPTYMVNYYNYLIENENSRPPGYFRSVYQICSKDLDENYSATVDVDDHEIWRITFPSQEDYVAFILRWS